MNTQDYWVFRLLPSAGFLETRKHDVSETVSVYVLGWGGKTPTQLGPLERPKQWLRLALSKGPTNWVGVFAPSLDGNRSSFRNVVFSSFYNTGRWITERVHCISKRGATWNEIFLKFILFATPRGLVNRYRRFGGTCSLQLTDWIVRPAWRNARDIRRGKMWLGPQRTKYWVPDP
jgi:hypothetical protein